MRSATRATGAAARTIQLQELQDHHIFPQAYLKRHGINKRAELNTIANRTLISDETNGKIRDKAPADYLADPEIFPSGPLPELLEPHFVAGPTVEAMAKAGEALDNQQAAAVYEHFLARREAAIVATIRQTCGVPGGPAAISAEADDDAADDLAADAAEAEVEDPALADLLIDLSA